MERKINPSNYELNQLKEYIDKCCSRCGRKFPDTILNITGKIEHNMPYQCVETEKCEQVRQINLYNLVKANGKSFRP